MLKVKLKFLSMGAELIKIQTSDDITILKSKLEEFARDFKVYSSQDQTISSNLEFDSVDSSPNSVSVDQVSLCL